MSVMIRGLTVQLEAGSGRDSTSGIAGPHFKRRASATTLPCLTSLRETHLREGSSFRMIKLRERKLFPSIRNQDPFMATYRQVSIGKKNSLPRRLQLRSVVVLCAAIPWLLLSMMTSGCRTKYREDLDYSYNVQQTWQLEDLNHGEIVQFESVFWEPDDTISLRKLIVDGEIALRPRRAGDRHGHRHLVDSMSSNDAKSVVATDINEAAVANAKYNSAMLVPDRRSGRATGFQASAASFCRDQRIGTFRPDPFQSALGGRPRRPTGGSCFLRSGICLDDVVA